MGMLLTYREGYYPKGAEPKAKRKRAKRSSQTRRGKAPEAPAAEAEAPVNEEASWSDLTDEQLAEAYATNIPDGEATERDAQIAELDALEAPAAAPAD